MDAKVRFQLHPFLLKPSLLTHPTPRDDPPHKGRGRPKPATAFFFRIARITPMPRVLVSDKLSPTAVQIFKDRGVDVDYLPDLGKDKDQLARRHRPV